MSIALKYLEFYDIYFSAAAFVAASRHQNKAFKMYGIAIPRLLPDEVVHKICHHFLFSENNYSNGNAQGCPSYISILWFLTLNHGLASLVVGLLVAS
jgi:hypothetical protein